MDISTKYFERLIIVILIALLPQTKFFAQGFTNANAASGIDVIHTGTPAYESKMDAGTGAAWFDFDNDGDLDLYIPMRVGANKLYVNQGDGTFVEDAASVGVDDIGGDGAAVAAADFNNDGWVDLYLGNAMEDKVLKNVNGSFTDITSTSGINVTDASRANSVSWGDYNDDGYLDLYVAHHATVLINQPSAGSQDYLYLNNGNETFTDVSTLFSKPDISGAGFIGGWTDFNNDNLLDIVLVNDCPVGTFTTPTKVFQNNGGNDPLTWNFTEVSSSIGMSECHNGMGIAVGDYNHDGWLDIFYSDIGPTNFFENNNGIFTNVTSTVGTGHDLPANVYSWGCNFFDYDNDGWEDLFVSFGHLWLNHPSYQNILYKNKGDLTGFVDKSTEQNLDDTYRTRTSICGDYDNDGDVDIFLVNYGEQCYLKRNDNDTGNNWLKLKLSGTASNTDAIGAKVKITTPDGMIQYFETKSGSSLGGGDSPYIHIGLGTNTEISELEVTWPAGGVQVVDNVDINTTKGVIENAALPVEINRFEINPLNGEVELSWETLSELENDYFSIEYSSNGKHFYEIGMVNGKGNSNAIQNYDFKHHNPVVGLNYYRLKQVDYNGKFRYTEIKVAEFKGHKQSFQIFPNPVYNKSFQLSCKGCDYEDSYEVNIYKMNGELVKSSVYNGYQENLKFNDLSLSPGVYFVNIQNDTFKKTERILIL